MEVDEILAAVDRGANGHASHDYDDSAARARDLQALTRAWVNEKGAPEVLPWPEDVMRRTLRRIREQVWLFPFVCWSTVVVDWLHLCIKLSVLS